MLRSLKSLEGYRIAAQDGELGKVHDFYFDDEYWIVRYLVVDTGNWLPGRKVLIIPGALGQPDWMQHSLPVALTREQVKNSPDITTDKPVSRQHEVLLHGYYGWPVYWDGAGAWPGVMAPVPAPMMTGQPPASAKKKEPGDPHLRSVREVTGYHIQASDGDVGHVEDFIADDTTWTVRYMVVDTRNWLPGRKVLVSPEWVVGQINHVERHVAVSLTRKSVKHSPEFDPTALVNRQYETQLYDYYGRPAYWRSTESG